MIQEENVKKISNTVSFSNDLFFKYAFSRDNDISLQLRKKLIWLISGINCKELTVRNPEYRDIIKKEESENIYEYYNGIHYRDIENINMMRLKMKDKEFCYVTNIKITDYNYRKMVENRKQGI